MKWCNKGKELEKIGKLFQARNKKIYIYGAGEFGKELYTNFFCVKDKITFVDINMDKQKNGYCDCDVISPIELFEIDIRDSIVILAMSHWNLSEIRTVLLKKGWVENQDFFSYQSFCGLYLPIYLCYVNNFSYIEEMTLLITQKCTLRCKHCSIVSPYLENPHNRGLELVKEDIDILFEKMDYIWKLSVIGGEPFLHPNFFEIVQYLEENYKDKYNHIHIVTNATVCPSDEVIKYMKLHDFKVSVSDYLPFLTNEITKDKIRNTLKKFGEFKLDYFLFENAKWVDFGFVDNQESEERESVDLINYFDLCNSGCKGFLNKHFIFCTPAFYADIALNKKVYDEMDGDNYFMTDNPIELLEWTLGYSEKGYLDMCKYCNGNVSINQHVVSPAIQME